MILVSRATLRTRDLAEDWPLMRESVPLGKEYFIDLRTVVSAVLTHLDTHRERPVTVGRDVLSGEYLILDVLDLDPPQLMEEHAITV